VMRPGLCLWSSERGRLFPVSRTNTDGKSLKAASSPGGLFVTASLVISNVDKPMTGRPTVSLAASAAATEEAGDGPGAAGAGVKLRSNP